MSKQTRPTDSIAAPQRRGWPFGLVALLGALAGATLFPRPARGGFRADPDSEAPGSGPRSG